LDVPLAKRCSEIQRREIYFQILENVRGADVSCAAVPCSGGQHLLELLLMTIVQAGVGVADYGGCRITAMRGRTGKTAAVPTRAVPDLKRTGQIWQFHAPQKAVRQCR